MILVDKSARPLNCVMQASLTLH